MCYIVIEPPQKHGCNKGATMIFSELSLAQNDFGLEYFSDNAALCGEKNGFGVCVYDMPDDNRYAVCIFAELHTQDFSSVTALVNKICEGLPKNTTVSHSEAAGGISVNLLRDALLQENITLLIEFLDKLTAALANAEIKGKPPVLKAIAAKKQQPAKAEKARTIKLRFDLGSVKGIFGAVIAAIVCVTLSVLAVSLDSAFFIGEVYAIAIGALTALLIIFDYAFLARKIDACGLIFNSVLTFLSIYISSYSVGVKEYLRLLPDKSLSDIFSEYTDLTSRFAESNPEITAFQLELFTKGLFAAAAASVVAYMIYFRRNSSEMYADEKTLQNTKKHR